MAAVGLIAPLVVASQLTPNRRGRGTHEQLGLPPCFSVVMFGVRCPSCGMTTSFAHLARGEFAAAAKANLGGVLLAGLSVAASAWFAWAGVAGRWPNRRVGPNTITVLLASVIVATLAQWAIRG